MRGIWSNFDQELIRNSIDSMAKNLDYIKFKGDRIKY